jgi:hypothetical protein
MLSRVKMSTPLRGELVINPSAARGGAEITIRPGISQIYRMCAGATGRAFQKGT